MSFFRNASPDTLRFVVAGERFVVPPGGEIHLAEAYAYVPRSRGLPLERANGPTPGATYVQGEPVRPTRPVYPAGVEAGGAPGPGRGAVAGEDEDDAPEDEDAPASPLPEDGEEPAEDPVAATVAQLKAQGVTLPGDARRGRGRGR